jgi:hypothetical protein
MSRSLLEKTFSLLGPEGRITNGALSVNCWPDQRYASAGAKQAWMRLEKLRSRVWQKLGLDHNVRWMRTIRKTTPQSRSPGTPSQSSTNQVIMQQPLVLDQVNVPNTNLILETQPQK